MYALIGYNGVGKTRLLASLGLVAATDDLSRCDDEVVLRYGRFIDPMPGIAAVVSVSYSAFDTFPIPGSGSGPPLGRAYSYCGLRRLPGAGDEDDVRTLKSSRDLQQEFHAAREQAVGKLREDALGDIFRPLLHEPSFAMAGDLPDLRATRAEWQDALERFSTGHTIVLTILVLLCARLERRSLVLLDEPEMHLHPPLVAALLNSVQVALEAFDSFAVAATHSPVVTQEIPGDQVLILRRAAGASAIEEPEVETFGENIGLLTSRIFHLDNTRSDFRRVLKLLAKSRPLEDIEELFPHGLSSQARVIVMSEQAEDNFDS
jgi:predicted ATPase